jgi:superfamily II DNA/RNA helicase
MTFEELGLGPKLLSAINDAGYSEPTPIQAGAIPVALTGRDVLGIAQTGTGKTASFVLPLIEKLSRGRAKARMPRSLIIAPTRELAAQCAENFEKYAKNEKLTMALLIGGVSFAPQVEILNRGADVLIATPGRLLDHFERGRLLLTGVQILVVDEADRMLDMGFIPDLEKIFSMTPPRKQTLFFSATMPKEIQSLVKKFLKDPERVEVARPATTSANIKQFIIRVGDKAAKAKRDALRDAMSMADVKNGIVFANRKRDVDVIARSLKKHGLSASPIHGDLDQSTRTATLAQFKSGELRFLIASDVAARGLDIPDVSHVYNYDIPNQADDYVHRIGRTGRAGKTGVSVSLIIPGDERALSAIEKLTKQDIPELSLKTLNSDSEETTKELKAEEPRKRTRKPRKKPANSNETAASVEATNKKSDPTDAKPEPKKVAEAAVPKREAAAAAKQDPKQSSGPQPVHQSGQHSGHTTNNRDKGGRNRRGRNGHYRDDLGPSFVGFGDHIPDFMNVRSR